MKIISALAVASLAASASATGVVVTFDASRCLSSSYQYYLTGNGMVGPLNVLMQDGWTLRETSFLTLADLQGADILATGVLLNGTTLAQSEADAMVNFVSAGGGLLYFGENNNWLALNNQFSALFNGPQYGGEYLQANDGIVVAPGHPLIQGPAGTVTNVTGLLAAGFWVNIPPTATTIFTNFDSSPGMVAFPFGGGRVVFLNDAGYFCWPQTYGPNNDVLWRNTLAWLNGVQTPTTSFCSGDGSATACPCGNFGATGAGCAHSLGMGASLSGVGTASIANDSFVLHATGMPDSTGLYLQGTLRLNLGLGVQFGDGLRCAGGVIARIGTKTSSGGASSYPGPGDTTISIRGNCTAGATRNYQEWYRNVAAFCLPAAFNLTNGLEVTWIP